MAKKTEQILLSEIIQLLRKQNQLSTRDRMKEAEEVRRQEKLDAENNEVGVDKNDNIIPPGEDFKRRMKANLAGKEVDRRRDAPAKRKSKKTQGVIAHATFMTRRLIESANRMSRMWRLKSTKLRLEEKKALDKKWKEDKRNRVEDLRERSKWNLKDQLEDFLTGHKLRQERRSEAWALLKENWKKIVFGGLLLLVTSIGMAYAGIHLWHTKILGILKDSKLWASAWGFITGRFVALRTAIYGWFGYDAKGKPKLVNVGPNEWKPLGWAGLMDRMGTRITDIRTKAYAALGYGPDGKTKINKPVGPRGVVKTFAWQSLGFASRATMLTKDFFKPIVSWTGGVAKLSGSKIWTNAKDLVAKIKNLGAVKFLSKLLWPVAAIFAVFEAFGSGKEESQKEGSKWYTVIGEATGAALGYLVGGLADAIKGIITWGLKKLFGFAVNPDGSVKVGESLGGDLLHAVEKFSFMDLIHKIVAFPFHAINAIVNFVGDLFSDPVGTAKGMWEWILDMPRRIVNWFKGMIPEKVRKFFGIEYDKYSGTDLEVHEVDNDGLIYRKVIGAHHRSVLPEDDPGFVAWQAKNQLYSDIANERNQEAFEFRKQRAIDIANGVYDPVVQRRWDAPPTNITNIQFQYKNEGYGDYIKHAYIQ